MLFRRGARQRQEPVSVVRGSPVAGPAAHGVRHFARDRGIQRLALVYSLQQFRVGVMRKIFLHGFFSENVRGVIGFLESLTREWRAALEARDFGNCSFSGATVHFFLLMVDENSCRHI